MTERLLPPALVRMARRASRLVDRAKLTRVRWDARDLRMRVAGFDVTLNDAANAQVIYKDVFLDRIYHFDAGRPDPRILDCGSNVGMSILYFKSVYPQARVIGFEPDPAIWPILEDNLARNGLSDVLIHKVAVGGREGSVRFHCDGKFASCFAELSGAESAGRVEVDVPCVRLRDHLTEPVDFLKMNIEGAEWEALADAEDRIHNLRALTLEYHHLPGLPRNLHEILALLHRSGFEYVVNDMDAETNPCAQPPFHLDASTRYFLLVHARRLG